MNQASPVSDCGAILEPPIMGSRIQRQNSDSGLRTPLRAPTRAAMLTLGIAGTTGLAVLTGASMGFELREAVLFSLPIGMLVGFLFAMLLIMIPEARARSHRHHLIEHIRGVSRIDRKSQFEDLLAFDDAHELCELAQAVHEAMVSAHKDRLEAAALRREMETRVHQRAQAVYAQLNRLTMTDELTGIYNRRGFEKGLSDLIESARREGEELSLLALDLDFFKRLNDTLGHDKGDEALRALGEILKACLRDGDLPCRVGGDEMFAVLYGAGFEVAQRVALRIMDLYNRHPAGRNLPCPWPTISVGVACLKLDGAETPEELRKQADQALYASKRRGRSRCTGYFELGRHELGMVGTAA